MVRDGTDALHDIARRALAVLRERGAPKADGAVSARLTPDGAPALDIRYSGPELPDAVPESVASYQMVSEQPPGWQGAHRLVVRAPLVVFDLCWNADEPLRIMGFSRGDWERDLMETAA